MSSAEKNKIKVVHYCNQLSIGGTERTMELFCKYLNKEKFEVFVVSKIHSPPILQKIKVKIGSIFQIPAALGKKRLWQSMNARENNFIEIVGPENVLFAKNDNHLREILLTLRPDILHVHYSGNPESPTSDERILSQIPVTLTTNQFEKENTSPAHRHVKKLFFVSEWMLKNKAHWAHPFQHAEIFYNPIESPCTSDSLRSELNIPPQAFVVGRVGRADPGIHDPISLRAFRQIEDSNTYFLALSPPENMIRLAKNLHLKNFIALPPSTDPVFLSKFYNTIDVMAHARRDGETFGCVIAEAMIHGKPVVSHLTSFMNAQQEIIGEAGYVCKQDDWKEYSQILQKLKEDKLYRANMSALAEKRAYSNFEARGLTQRLERTYIQLLNENKK